LPIWVRRSRLRTGGHSWRLYHSVEQADLFLERFTVVSWSEFERQRSERWLGYDSENFTKAVDYTVDHTRTDEYYIAKRVHRGGPAVTSPEPDIRWRAVPHRPRTCR